MRTTNSTTPTATASLEENTTETAEENKNDVSSSNEITTKKEKASATSEFMEVVPNDMIPSSKEVKARHDFWTNAKTIEPGFWKNKKLTKDDDSKESKNRMLISLSGKQDESEPGPDYTAANVDESNESQNVTIVSQEEQLKKSTSALAKLFDMINKMIE